MNSIAFKLIAFYNITNYNTLFTEYNSVLPLVNHVITVLNTRRICLCFTCNKIVEYDGSHADCIRERAGYIKTNNMVDFMFVRHVYFRRICFEPNTLIRNRNYSLRKNVLLLILIQKATNSKVLKCMSNKQHIEILLATAEHIKSNFII